MEAPVTTEEIYDALLDEQAFAALTERIARSLNAPSWIVGWIYSDGTQILPDAPRHWSPKLLADYAEHFAGSDPWTIAQARNMRPNRVADVGELVSEKEWTGSALYNEFLVPNRMKLMHSVCIAGQNETGMGCFALHREAGQKPFSPEEIASLDQVAPHFGRMLALKAKLHRLELTERMSRQTLDGVAHPIFMLTADRRILIHNEAAERALRRGEAVRIRDGRLDFDCEKPDLARAAVAAAAAPGAVTASSLLMETRGGKRVIATTVPRVAAGIRSAMLWLQPLGGPNHSVSRHLSAIFGLTDSEASIAELLADGRPPADIADQRQTSVHTVRTQIKNVTAKMGCRRVSEVVAIVRSMPASHQSDNGFSNVKRP